jgi:two-component system cell cycle response regulator DivK
MDIEMPVMDGIEALKMLKSEPHTSRIPIVAVTGYSTGTDEENREMLLNEGFDGYISKPFQVNEFFAEVNKHISDRSGYLS